ncbi:MAG: hypothetical protein HYX61_02955 [Gammaproteobacteria bacterium]|jgi:hypothetical protein|nr:hypothetical protein [Gammaproteobacteria bacterium]
MARIRTVKPEFWTSEQVASCSREARLLFIGMWNFCDDAGIHPKSFMRLKMEVFPGDDCSGIDIEVWMSELINVGLVIEYSAEGKEYWLVTGWKHQKIEKPTYRYPCPVTYFSKGDKHQLIDQTTNTPQLLVEHSSNGRQPLTPVREGKGKGMEEDICKVSGETSSLSLSENDQTANTYEAGNDSNDQQLNTPTHKKDKCIISEIFEYWKAKMNHPRAKLDEKRKKIIKAAFKQGYSLEELKLAIEGCHKTPYNMGVNPQKKKYDDIGLILRDSSHIERFMQNATENSNESSLDLKVSQIDQIAEGAI